MSKNKELLVFESRKLGSPVIPVFSVLFDGAVVLGAATLVKKNLFGWSTDFSSCEVLQVFFAHIE